MHDADAMRPMRFFLSLLFALSAATAMAQHSVADAQQHLLSLRTQNSETDVPPPVQSAIAVLKQALADATYAIMAASPAGTPIASLQQRITAALPSKSIGTHTDAEWVTLGNRNEDTPITGLYGGGLYTAVTSPRPGLVLVEERFDIECGADTLLLAYRSEGGCWSRVLRWDSGRYEKMSGAFGDN